MTTWRFMNGIALIAMFASQMAVATTLDGNIDARINAPELWQRAISTHAAERRRAEVGKRLDVIDLAIERLSQQSPGLRVRRSLASGGVDVLYSETGAMSKAAPGASSEQIAREFLLAHREIYGLSARDVEQLHVLGDSPGGPSGLRMLRLEQRVAGVPVFESDTRALIDRKGRVWRVLGALLPSAAGGAPKLSRNDLIGADEAMSRLFGWAGFALDAKSVVISKRADADWMALSAPAPVAGPASARLVWFALEPGVMIPAWSMTVFTTGNEDWYALIDARSGDLLWRKNMREYASTQQARFGVYVQADGITPADSPAPQSPNVAVPGSGTQYPAMARSIVKMSDAQSPLVSPNGWIDDCVGPPLGCGITLGNNVDACLDTLAPANSCDATLDASGRPIGNPDADARPRDFFGAAPQDFEYTPAPLVANPDAGDSPTNADSQRGALVQAFYTINWFHDRMAKLGFDEASGNFQQLNLLGQGGLGGDRVAADVQNAGANTASFSTPADGAGNGRLSLSIFTGPSPDRDSALDSGIVIHELTHGMTHRLIGNSQGLLWDVARSMGEGWSDFYALALLNNEPADQETGRYPFAPWISYKLGANTVTDNYVYGFRRFPYSTDPAFDPLTFADVDAVLANEPNGGIPPSPLNFDAFGALEVHNAGSVWAKALWKLRAGIIAQEGVASGNETTLQLVTDALKLTPVHASFIDGRDALLAADCATNACANEREIWEAFADMELGYKAVAPLAVMGRFALAHMGVGVSRELPYLDVLNAATDVVINDEVSSNGNGRLDPGETVTLSIALTNPLHLAELGATGVSATLASPSAAVTFGEDFANYPDIPVQSTVANSDLFTLKLASNANCGDAVPLELTTVSNLLGTRTAKFTLRVGVENGVGQPITYSAAPNLPIPVSSINGVSTNLDITEDVVIRDLNFRIDQLTHPVTGHLSVMLRAPNGYGTDLIFKRGGFMVPNQGGGADFTDLVIDDDLAIIASEDLNQSLSTQAPFSGDWLPAFNGPFWNTYRPTPPSPAADITRDSVGVLSRLDGQSSKGRWTINVANGSNALPGFLNKWSLIVTPKNFVCTVYVPGDAVFANGFESPQIGPVRAASNVREDQAGLASSAVAQSDRDAFTCPISVASAVQEDQ